MNFNDGLQLSLTEWIFDLMNFARPNTGQSNQQATKTSSDILKDALSDKLSVYDELKIDESLKNKPSTL